jgi:hypothetical protein
MFRLVFAVLSAAFALSACGGGGGGSSTAGSVSPGGGSTGGGSGTQSLAPASISVSFQQYTPVKTSSIRRAAFVSPATQSIGIAVLVANGTTIPNPVATTFNVGPTATGCTASGGTVTCTASINAPVGSDVLAITSYGGQNGAGTPLGTTQAPVTIVQNSTNRIPLSIGGTIANLQVYLANPNFTLGTAATSLVVIVPLDASGAVIVNPGDYNPAITVTSSNTSGAFSLILDGSPSGNAATVNSPNDQAVLAYNGSGTTTVSTTVTISAGTTVTPQSATAQASLNAPGLHGSGGGTGFTASMPDQFIFTAAGQIGTLSVSGGVPPYTVATSNASVATVGGASPSFTVTSVGVGSTTITVTDSAPTPNHFSYPVTFVPPPIAIAVNSCGSQATCTTTGITFPQGTPNGNETGTIALGGGTGTYTYYFGISGTTTSVYANVSQAGNLLTITPTGSGNDVLVVQSGSQTALYTITTGSPFAASLPAAAGLLVEDGLGKNFSLTLPATVTSVTQTSGLTDNNLLFSAPVLTATPMTGGTGNWLMTDAGGDTGNVPWTVFQLTFGTYAGPGAASASETYNAPGADEAFTGNSETDSVTVAGVGGTLTATSSNPNLVGVTVNSSTSLTVASAASGNGFATITLKDSATGGSAAYSVSVTTTTIPISSRNRR